MAYHKKKKKKDNKKPTTHRVQSSSSSFKENKKKVQDLWVSFLNSILLQSWKSEMGHGWKEKVLFYTLLSSETEKAPLGNSP